MALIEAEGSELNNAVLNEDSLLKFIIEEAVEDKKIKAGASTSRHRRGYIAHLINLSTKLVELA